MERAGQMHMVFGKYKMLCFTYQKLPGIRPRRSIKPFHNNPSLILKLPLINHIWSLFPMFRNYIFHRKPRCRHPEGFNVVFTECRQIIEFTPLFLIYKDQTTQRSKWHHIYKQTKTSHFTYPHCGLRELIHYSQNSNNTWWALNTRNPFQ